MLLEAPQRPSSTLARHPTGRTPSRRSQASRRVLADEARGRRCRRHHLRLLCNPPCPSEIGRSVGRLHGTRGPTAHTNKRARIPTHRRVCFLYRQYASSRVDTMLVIPSPHTLGRTFYTSVTFSRRCVAVHTGRTGSDSFVSGGCHGPSGSAVYSTRGVELRELVRAVLRPFRDRITDGRGRPRITPTHECKSNDVTTTQVARACCLVLACLPGPQASYSMYVIT